MKRHQCKGCDKPSRSHFCEGTHGLGRCSFRPYFHFPFPTIQITISYRSNTPGRRRHGQGVLEQRRHHHRQILAFAGKIGPMTENRGDLPYRWRPTLPHSPPMSFLLPSFVRCHGHRHSLLSSANQSLRPLHGFSSLLISPRPLESSPWLTAST